MARFSIIETPQNRPFFDRGGGARICLILGGGVRHFSGGVLKIGYNYGNGHPIPCLICLKLIIFDSYQRISTHSKESQKKC